MLDFSVVVIVVGCCWFLYRLFFQFMLSSYFPVMCWCATLCVGAVAVLSALAWQGQWVKRPSLCTHFFPLVLGLLNES